MGKKIQIFLKLLILLIIFLGIVFLTKYYKNENNEDNQETKQETEQETSIDPNIKYIGDCQYKEFIPTSEKQYDYTQDMEYEDKIYHKEILTYQEYTIYKDRWNEIIDMTEEDFNNKFMVITAVENTSMIGLTVSKIYAETDTLYIYLNNYPDGVQYDKAKACISIVIPKDMKRENIKVLDGRKIDAEKEEKDSIAEKYGWVNESTEGLEAISFEDAITIAKDYAQELYNSHSYMGQYLKDYTKVYDVQRTTVKPNNYWLIEEGIVERNFKQADYTRDVYEVTLVKPEDEVEAERAIFYVDMYTGKVIGGREMAE